GGRPAAGAGRPLDLDGVRGDEDHVGLRGHRMDPHDLAAGLPHVTEVETLTDGGRCADLLGELPLRGGDRVLGLRVVLALDDAPRTGPTRPEGAAHVGEEDLETTPGTGTVGQQPGAVAWHVPEVSRGGRIACGAWTPSTSSTPARRRTRA